MAFITRLLGNGRQMVFIIIPIAMITSPIGCPTGGRMNNEAKNKIFTVLYQLDDGTYVFTERDKKINEQCAVNYELTFEEAE